MLPSADGPRWRDRFYAATAATEATVRVMPVELGPSPGGVDPFERANLWLLHSALALGIDKVRFITLWNGGGGDGPGVPPAHGQRGQAPDRAGGLARHQGVIQVDAAIDVIVCPGRAHRCRGRRDDGQRLRSPRDAFFK